MRILRGVGSQTLPCGCLIGLYETYGGPVVALVDARGSTCSDEQHRVDHAVPIEHLRPEKLPNQDRN